ncbi:XRE family transcriptional regulator [Chromobacterium vaccinii]|uniref:XRE family transcriptional regulator n=1 Tax=Chromobacterium vaccinii TaxID=1108595 RepID=UPI003C7226F0
MRSSSPAWLDLLRAEAARGSIGTAAAAVGYSRSTVSLVLAGKYPAPVDRIAAAVMLRLAPASTHCPYLEQSIERVECQRISSGPVPTHNPLKLAHWRACQQCQNRCKGE